ncbi:MAG: hypothetical protein U9Q89_06585 [Thermodesulfobacteriota bacterium]|nr:hypothetical protein [Thermodesulfobacteriota bacterium]
MLIKKIIALMGLVGIIIAFSGCSETPSRVDANYGESVRQAKTSQILYPDAGENLDPCEGLDGQAAATVMHEYREGFKKEEEKKSIISILGE